MNIMAFGTGQTLGSELPVPTLIYFRQSLLAALDRLIRPYYKKFSLTFNRRKDTSDDEDSDDQVFADFDDEKGVVFYPPMYAQRYAAVSDCLMDERWCGKLEKVVDLGFHDISFIKYLKEVPGVHFILGVDIDSIPLRCSFDLLGTDDYVPKRGGQLQITLYQGNAADPDYRLIGSDAVVAIEMIEHMLPHDLDRLVHTVFGFIKPWIAVFTTPNADFNILFKSLQKNGLRRLDHFFEWTREQFHDWCSNIVVRYPQYTVTCRGIGPGPPGTRHHGCCSQLALFISKDYQKQQDLNLNSLALVANAPDPSTQLLSDIVEEFDYGDESQMLCLPNKIESLTDMQYSSQQSCLTIVLAAPALSLDTFEYSDKTSQCNIDTEAGKSFLMYNVEDLCYNVLSPTRRINNRVYEIEDVASRLNCSTFHVTKFSKPTQNLMARHKVDTLVHTREVVDEIRHLTNLLNFNKRSLVEHSDRHTWCNINWGDNAPYWNQYYTVVRQFNYPFESKSEEDRMLELLTDEINRLMDNKNNANLSMDDVRLEIPMSYLMLVVGDITDDEERVKDLLLWNGYEIVDDVLVHTLALDDSSLVSQEDEATSDWDSTDVHSTSYSDTSTLVPDYHGKRLRRALDRKVRKLRSMLSADEDIITELDRVVCRLMKLALRSSRGRQRPPPTRWMQCKMLDMLTLTEKAIERRKRHYIDNYQLKAICYGQDEEKSLNMQALEKIKDDDLAAKLVDKYDEIVHPEKINKIKYLGADIQELDDFSTFSTNEFFKDNEIYYDRKHSYPVHNDLILNSNLYDALLEVKNDETQLARTKAWVEDDVKTTSYPTFDIGGNISSGDTDSALIAQPTKPKRSSQKRNVICDKNADELKVKPSKTFRSKTSHDKNMNKHDKNRNISKTTLISKVVRKKSGCNNFIKKYNYRVSSECRMKKEHQNLQSTASKPIPESLIKLCHPELKERIISEFSDDSSKHNNAVNIIRSTETVAITKESLLIDIIMDDAQETIALRRTVATDAESEPLADEQETFLESVINVTTDDSFCNKIQNSTENVHSQSIFVYDINEPSTSKGIRHVGMDVQCGTDTKMQNFPMLSATTSLTRMPKIFTNGIKIGDSLTHLKNDEKQCSDFGTTTNNDDDDNSKVLHTNLKSVGIKIKDSFDKICKKFECSTMTNTETVHDVPRTASPSPCFYSSVYESKTKLLKPISSELKLDSCSEFCSSGISSSKSPLHFMTAPKLENEIGIKSSINKEIGIASRFSPVKLVTSKLCCGGVHIHSYKDRQETEDIVYQGEWQRQRPKLSRKSDLSQFLPNNLFENRTIKKKPISKEKLLYKKPLKLKNNEIRVDAKPPVCLKNPISKYKEKLLAKPSSKKKETKIDLRQPVYAKNTQFNKLKQETLTRLQKRHKLDIDNGQVKVTRSNKNLNKVKSKVRMNIVSTKQMHTVVKKIPLSDLKKNDQVPQCLRKTYLPTYLKRNLGKPLATNNNYLNRSIDTVTNKDKIGRNIPVLGKSKTDEIKTELLKYRNKSRLNVNYAVFRNEIENKKNNSEGETTEGRPTGTTTYNTTENNAKLRTSSPLSNYSGIRNDIDLKKSNIAEQSTKNNDGMPKCLTHKRIHSPGSQHSSECSSPDSIATAVRVKSSQEKTVSSKRQSTSSYKRNLGKASSSDKNTTPTRNKKLTKIYQECSDKDIEDKENVSQNTYNEKYSVNDSANAKFSGRSKNIFIAQLQKENLPSNSPNTHKTPNKSSMKIPTSQCSDENKKFNVSSVSKKKSESVSFKSDCNSLVEKQTTLDCNSNENAVLVVEPFIVSKDSEKEVNSESVNDNVNALTKLEEQSKWENNSSANIVEGVNSILLAMKQLVEERLNFINSSCSSSDPIDSETIILSRNSNRSSSRNASVSSPTSFKTILENEDIVNTMLESSIEDALDRTFDTTLGDESLLSLSDSTRLTMTDMDMLSFKSFATMNEEINEQNPVAVQDIFERKDLHKISNTIPGVIAIQAFSGFSIDAEPVIGDQADYVNRIDSETGSGALNVARRTNSEELFVSGRSSESYQTCLVEDDSVVPNWLFHIISRQESIEEEEQPEPMYLMPVEMPMPLEDPAVFDLNGNAVEANMAAGAGDGRGIHSDHSQDSSGQGTSLSSTDMSTGQPSEAVLVDPSAYSGQYSALRDSVGGSPMVVGIPIDMSTAFATLQQNGATTASQEQRISRRRRHHSVAASDMDADVSSIDTDVDVPESSDN